MKQQFAGWLLFRFVVTHHSESPEDLLHDFPKKQTSTSIGIHSQLLFSVVGRSHRSILFGTEHAEFTESRVCGDRQDTDISESSVNSVARKRSGKSRKIYVWLCPTMVGGSALPMSGTA